MLAGIAADFPIREWDELLPQTILTLNLMRQSHVAPNISTYAYHHGHSPFHIKPNRCRTWGEHSMDGWYLQTSPEHYRCHIVFVKKTQAKRVTDTLFFKHKYLTQPEVTPADMIIKAYSDLTSALHDITNTRDDTQMDLYNKFNNNSNQATEEKLNINSSTDFQGWSNQATRNLPELCYRKLQE